MALYKRSQLDLSLLNQIYNILEGACDAPTSKREEFIYSFLHRGSEFRFQGALGFGGKFYHQKGNIWVSCYPEDETDARLAMIERATTLLAALAAPVSI